MPKINQDQLIESYIEWLHSRISIEDLDGIYQITSPYLDVNNDRLQIYVSNEGDILKLSDDGQVINELEMSGCHISNSKKRMEILNFILNKFGVKKNGDELFIHATLDNFAQKKHSLLQAMLSVNDMFMTTRANVTSVFLEEVENFLNENDIRFSDNVSFIGKSGFTHNFDFVIPKYRKVPERIIKVINNPRRDTAESLIFSWNETKETRKSDAVMYAFLNDENKSVSDSLISAFKQYEIKTVQWSMKDQYLHELTA